MYRVFGGDEGRTSVQMFVIPGRPQIQDVTSQWDSPPKTANKVF